MTPERRKLVTCLFCDLVGSTELGEEQDPEVVRARVARYFQEMRSAVERHGGTVEKFAGDAVMAVFGVPKAHEDDALRACRAALEMQERSPLPCRIGVATGEVVAGEGEQTFVTGDAANTAARLEQAAAPGEALIGEQTYLLVRSVARADAVAPIAAKGKREPVTAFRLTFAPVAPEPSPGEAPLVGREAEAARLVNEFDRAVSEHGCRLVTLVGEPGVGKSRLVQELEGRVDGRVLHGRCLSYGEGITFWPLAEIVREAADVREEDSLEEARAKIARLVAADLVGRVEALVGLGGSISADELPWVVRRLVSGLAAERPLVLVLEDVHWAEETLLDLLAGLGGVEAPALLLVTARPDLLERRPDWPGVVRLEPLSDEAATALLQELLGGDPGPELIARAGGNPLFVQELAAFLRQHGHVEGVPTSLSALLTARLDALPAPDRDTVERASVEGEVFHRRAVAALLDAGESEAAERLSALVERELAFAAQARYLDDAAFRFRHVLVRDAAYAGLVKRLRAELHERFADWLETRAGERLAELEEIVGYHLEQAFRYADELGLETGALRERAADRLYTAGVRAAGRGDVPASVNLLGRSVELTAVSSTSRVGRLLDLADMLFSAGEGERMVAAYDEAEKLALAAGEARARLFARLQRVRYGLDFGLAGHTPDEVLAVAREAIPVFEREGDERGLAAAWMGIGDYHRERREIGRWGEAYEHALIHARRSGDRRQIAMTLARLAGTFGSGPTPLDETIARIETELDDPEFPAQPRAVWTAFLGGLEASRGNLERGRELCRSGRALADELGNVIAVAITTAAAADVEELAGDLLEAERLVREVVERLEAIGHGWAASYRTELARLALAQGRLDEAEALLARGDSTERANAVVRAGLLTRRGRHAEAEQLLREALDSVAQTDATPAQAEMQRALADVLRLAGKTAEARAALERALELEEARGATLIAERTLRLLAELP